MCTFYVVYLGCDKMMSMFETCRNLYIAFQFEDLEHGLAVFGNKGFEKKLPL